MSIASPCINECQLDQGREYCQGCLRTLDEIRAWSSSSEQEKLAVWERLGRRPSDHKTPHN
ncbi:MAG: DUF1289 domain-containing protein [Deefgea sp.]